MPSYIRHKFVWPGLGFRANCCLCGITIARRRFESCPRKPTNRRRKHSALRGEPVPTCATHPDICKPLSERTGND